MLPENVDPRVEIWAAGTQGLWSGCGGGETRCPQLEVVHMGRAGKPGRGRAWRAGPEPPNTQPALPWASPGFGTTVAHRSFHQEHQKSMDVPIVSVNINDERPAWTLLRRRVPGEKGRPGDP